MKLREQVIDIDVPEEGWSPNNGEKVGEDILALNLFRRLLTADQRAMLVAVDLDSYRRKAAKRQENTRFTADVKQPAPPVGSPR